MTATTAVRRQQRDNSGRMTAMKKKEASSWFSYFYSIHLYLCPFFSYFCRIVVVFIPCCTVLFILFFPVNFFIFDACASFLTRARHFWRAFASMADAKTLRSLKNILTQFWIFNLFLNFFKNAFCFFSSKFLNWGTVTLFSYLNWVTFHFKSRYFRKEDLWKSLVWLIILPYFWRHFPDA